MSDKRKCKDCIFGDICSEIHVCDDYAPVEESDRHIDKLIELGREKFSEDWDEYINEYAE